MPAAANGFNGARNGAGLMITAAVHVALGAALLSLGVIKLPAPPPQAIRIRNVPLPPEPVDAPQPKIIDQTIDIPMSVPVVDIMPDLPPPPPVVTTTEVRPPVGTAGRGDGIAPGKPPSEPQFVTARLDPRYAARFQPPYPPASKRQDEEGVVVVRVRVGPDGHVLAAELKASSGHRRLDEAAVEHARRAWRFVPATRDGVAVESWREIPVRFELKNG